MEEIKINFIKDILKNWQITDNSTITRTNQGVVNKNWIIVDKQRKYVLKEIEKSKKEENLIFEMNYLQTLKSKGFPYQIPQPISTTDGNYFVRYQDHFYWLYDYIQGVSEVELTQNHIKQIAEMLATYHNIIEKSQFNNNQPKNLRYSELVYEELRDYLNNFNILSKSNEEDKLLSEYGPYLEKILLGINNQNYLDLPRFPIHRDLGGDNIVWNNDNLTGIIDFENVSEYNEPFIKDLSVIITYSCRNSNDPYQTDFATMKILIEQYISIRKLRTNELSYIPDFIINGIIEDFNYAYWLAKNDSQRFSLSRMKRYAESAIWHFENRDEIRKNLLI